MKYFSKEEIKKSTDSRLNVIVYNMSVNFNNMGWFPVSSIYEKNNVMLLYDALFYHNNSIFTRTTFLNYRLPVRNLYLAGIFMFYHAESNSYCLYSNNSLFLLDIDKCFNYFDVEINRNFIYLYVKDVLFTLCLKSCYFDPAIMNSVNVMLPLIRKDDFLFVVNKEYTNKGLYKSIFSYTKGRFFNRIKIKICSEENISMFTIDNILNFISSDMFLLKKKNDLGQERKNIEDVVSYAFKKEYPLKGKVVWVEQIDGILDEETSDEEDDYMDYEDNEEYTEDETEFQKMLRETQ